MDIDITKDPGPYHETAESAQGPVMLGRVNDQLVIRGKGQDLQRLGSNMAVQKWSCGLVAFPQLVPGWVIYFWDLPSSKLEVQYPFYIPQDWGRPLSAGS